MPNQTSQPSPLPAWDYIAERTDPLFPLWRNPNYCPPLPWWWREKPLHAFIAQPGVSTAIVEVREDEGAYEVAWVMMRHFYEEVPQDLRGPYRIGELPRPVVLVTAGPPHRVKQEPDPVLRSIITRMFFELGERGLRDFLMRECGFSREDFVLDLDDHDHISKSIDEILQMLGDAIPKVRERFYPTNRQQDGSSGKPPGPLARPCCLVTDMDRALYYYNRERVKRLARIIEDWFGVMQGRKVILFVSGKVETIKGFLRNPDDVVEIPMGPGIAR
ncbi:hypothetical protein DL769_005915 [Monosporascus sp. CRB-8-3]|nr:hypothetical protein DL769_005915 [Monosporascus sp. CRB-8-3]